MCIIPLSIIGLMYMHQNPMQMPKVGPILHIPIIVIGKIFLLIITNVLTIKCIIMPINIYSLHLRTMSISFRPYKCYLVDTPEPSHRLVFYNKIRTFLSILYPLDKLEVGISNIAVQKS